MVFLLILQLVQLKVSLIMLVIDGVLLVLMTLCLISALHVSNANAIVCNCEINPVVSKCNTCFTRLLQHANLSFWRLLWCKWGR